MSEYGHPPLFDLPNLELEQLNAVKAIAGAALVEKIDAELERRRRETLARAATTPARTDQRIDRLEREEQALIYADLVKIGCKVYWLSQPRETMQTRGVPDLIVFGPSSAQFTFIEVKRPGGGKISLEQSEFRARCGAAGIDHVLGDRAEVAARFGYTFDEDA